MVLANKDTKYKAAVGEIIKWITLDTSETGNQYIWANGEYYNETRDAVGSAAGMEKLDSSYDFLGGQNRFEPYISSGENTRGNNLTQYDEVINSYWYREVLEYAKGENQGNRRLLTLSSVWQRILALALTSFPKNTKGARLQIQEAVNGY